MSSPTPSATPETSRIELLGADGDPDAVEAFSAVSAFYQAFNTSDIDTYADTFIDVDPSEFPDSYENELAYLEAARAAGARYEVAPCNYVGIIEAEPDEDSRHDGMLVGHGFECTTTMIDDFTTAADIDVVGVWTWLVDHEAVLVDSDYRTWDELRDFMSGLLVWFRREHTDTNELDVLTFYNYPIASDVPKVLAVTEQYLSESSG